MSSTVVAQTPANWLIEQYEIAALYVLPPWSRPIIEFTDDMRPCISMRVVPSDYNAPGWRRL